MRRTANALAVESDEVLVISNESLEANVVAIRTDLTEFRADFRIAVARTDQDIRAMGAKAEGDNRTSAARIDEQLREGRQDIRELRADNKTLRDKIDETRASLSAKIDGVHVFLSGRIDETQASLSAKIDENRSFLDNKIDTKAGELATDMKAIRSDIADLKAMQKAVLWVLGGVGTAVAVLGLARTLNWI